MLNLKPLVPTIKPVCNSPSRIGHGEGIEYDNAYYYYIVGKHIPKDKVVALKSESQYCGRVNGEKEYIIITWDKSQQSFVLLEHCCYEVKRYIKKYIGKKPDEAIAMRMAELDKIQADYDATPKCSYCNNPVIVFHDGQDKNTCSSCFEKKVASWQG